MVCSSTLSIWHAKFRDLRGTSINWPYVKVQQASYHQKQVTTYIERLDRDQSFWWKATGVPLTTLLACAGYSTELQDQSIVFYIRNVIPYLGPGPDDHGSPQTWKSFMTDHFCPVEMSWDWGIDAQDPVIRLSFEPIVKFEDKSKDPLNQNTGLSSVLQCWSRLSGCDLRLFHHFYTRLLSYEAGPETLQEGVLHGHQSRMFLGFDLGRDSTVLKAYFLPAFKATERGHSTLDLITEAIDGLDSNYTSIQTSYKALRHFITASREALRLQVEIFAIDCVEPTLSRLKVYVRSMSTSWNSVKAVMTMNGLQQNPSTDCGLKKLKTLWNLVLGLAAETADDDELPATTHRTAGVLYYAELRPNKLAPTWKIYIPVRHYGKSDIEIVKGLKTYMKSVRKNNLASRYRDAVRQFSSPTPLETNIGTQTYIGCSIVGDQLKITSYLSPKVFD